MSQTSRLCPECGGERAFVTFHDQPGSCPDSADGECPEQACASCGAAWLTGFVPEQAARQAERVA